MRTLLVRGMLAGLLAALAALVVATVAGEPQVRDAIALEGAGHAHGTGAAASPTQGSAATASDQPGAMSEDGAEPVSRQVQSTLGLALAIGLYGVAVGG